MVELIIGASIGAFVSLLIAEVYHRRSSNNLNQLIARLQEKNEKLGEMIADLEEWHKLHYDDLQIIRKHAVVGTPDNPEYPYK
jgi:uncharacterized protein YbgA (DUF1722 family)